MHPQAIVKNRAMREFLADWFDVLVVGTLLFVIYGLSWQMCVLLLGYVVADYCLTER